MQKIDFEAMHEKPTLLIGAGPLTCAFCSREPAEAVLEKVNASELFRYPGLRWKHLQSNTCDSEDPTGAQRHHHVFVLTSDEMEKAAAEREAEASKAYL